MKKFWPLSVSTWGDEERAAAHRIIDSDQHTYHTEVKAFEAELAAAHGRKYAVMTNSGSSANLIAVGAMQILQNSVKRVDDREIIVPAIAWSTTYAPLQQHGYRMVVVDVDPSTLNADNHEIAAALRRKTVGMIGVSILGNPADLTWMRGFCDAHDLFFIEDNCESMGASIDGKICGSFGDISTLSFFYSHHLNTVEGGAVLTDNEFAYELLVCLRAHGWARDLPADSILAGDNPEKGYRFLVPGYNVRPMELSAAVGSIQLRKQDELSYMRKQNATYFRHRYDISAPRRFEIQRSIHGAIPNPFGFTMVFQTPLMRDCIGLALDRVGIEHRLITGGSFALHEAERFYEYRFARGAAPNADRAHRCGLFVGNHGFDLKPQIDLLFHTIDTIEAPLQ